MSWLEFECDACSHQKEMEFPGLIPTDLPEQVCRKCTSPMRRVFSVPNVCNKAKDEGWEGYNTGLGEVALSRAHAMDLAKRKGLNWVGDEGYKEQRVAREEIVELGHERREKEAKVQRSYGPDYRRSLVDQYGVPVYPERALTPAEELRRRYGSVAGGQATLSYLEGEEVGNRKTINATV